MPSRVRALAVRTSRSAPSSCDAIPVPALTPRPLLRQRRPRHDFADPLGIASGVYNTFGQVGSAVVLAIVTTAATLASRSSGANGAETADLVRNSYLAITVLLFFGVGVTWLTAHRPRDAVIPAPTELLHPPRSAGAEGPNPAS